MEAKTITQSQRLYVRTWKRDDLDALYRVMSQPQTHVNRIHEEPWSKEGMQSWLEWHIDHMIGR